ncbi:MAG: SUMF1/EgtB/PvdO family nonheme iron enzyme [Bacteroidetes bacterium]|nr:SUMF1/EgtB/PvdO family nonheme iron enzyme [Bacteroidota bacterium]
MIRIYHLLILLLVLVGCSTNERLVPVSVADFEKFVSQTGYITDAERYGWSIVQLDVYNFKLVENAIWTQPDGVHAPRKKTLPVTQVSYNDAVAYCKWAGVRLPTYEEYWKFVANDHRVIVSDNTLPISPVDSVSVVGNVWDITAPINSEQIRLAGGSLFCSPNTCHGTQKDRELYVDKETGNINCGFSVVVAD